MTKSTTILNVEVSYLQRHLEASCAIFSANFVELWISELNIEISRIFIVRWSINRERSPENVTQQILSTSTSPSRLWFLFFQQLHDAVKKILSGKKELEAGKVDVLRLETRPTSIVIRISTGLFAKFKVSIIFHRVCEYSLEACSAPVVTSILENCEEAERSRELNATRTSICSESKNANFLFNPLTTVDA